jgi:N-acetylglucosamine kinase-like BadF-type ATPase
MTRYFLGIDTGATKSHALIADEQGQAVGFGQAGGGNWEVVGWDGTQVVLNSIIDQALAAAGLDKSDIAGAGFGLAGYDWPEDYEPHVRLIEALGLNAPYTFGNDTLVGLVAGASAGWGVVVVAGTSNNCRGRDPNGREGRITGHGFRFGEYGGAGELVAKAVQVVTAEWTRRGRATQLTPAFIKVTGAADLSDLIGGLARHRYRLSAAHAPLIFEVAAAGDEVATELIRWSGRELGSLANGVMRQLGLEASPVEVVLAGSLYQGSPLLIEAMAETIHAVAPRARLVRLDAPPVVGGVLLGMEQVGLKPADYRARLIETTKRLLPQLKTTEE